MATVHQLPATHNEPGWYRTLPKPGKRAFFGAFLGWGLDSYDFWVLPLGITAIAATFGLSNGQSGWLGTTTLICSAVGGVIAGALADRIGRVRTLIVTVLVYAICTALCGLAPNYETLLVLRGLQGIGFGGDWATGAVLVAEYIAAKHRGRAIAVVQSAWAVGWALAVGAYVLVFSIADDRWAWRILFLTGVLPAFAVFVLRRGASDAPAYRDKRERSTIADIVRPDLLRTTVFASILSTGLQGGYYTIATWLPAFLSKEKHLPATGVGGFLAFTIGGAFVGYLVGGYLADRIGRKVTFQLFAVLSAVAIVLYTTLPASANGYVMYLGFPLGFCSSAIFSGTGAYLAELYPVRVRATGQGFTYNFGRGVGAFFPTVVGILSTSFGLGGAMAFGALAYVIAFVALFWLPETRDRELA